MLYRPPSPSTGTLSSTVFIMECIVCVPVCDRGEKATPRVLGLMHSAATASKPQSRSPLNSKASFCRFTPTERGCYFEGELGLKYLPVGLYRYGISNCLFEATYEKALEICKCTPYFHWAGIQEYGNFCRGKVRIRRLRLRFQISSVYRVTM